MEVHYSKPKGFVGRNICYAIEYKGIYYGHIVGGSATRFLPGRNDFLEVDLAKLNNLVNNIYYHIEPHLGKYPHRNFVPTILGCWRRAIALDWPEKYGDRVLGFESLVELPRTGECYLRDGWIEVGQTKGYTCKRVAGVGTDNWTGKRVWNTSLEELRPKRVFCHKP